MKLLAVETVVILCVLIGVAAAQPSADDQAAFYQATKQFDLESVGEVPDICYFVRPSSAPGPGSDPRTGGLAPGLKGGNVAACVEAARAALQKQSARKPSGPTAQQALEARLGIKPAPPKRQAQQERDADAFDKKPANWKTVKADNGAVYRVDLAHVRFNTTGAREAIVAAPKQAPGNMLFDCEGHFIDETYGFALGQQYAPPRSAVGVIASLVCSKK